MPNFVDRHPYTIKKTLCERFYDYATSIIGSKGIYPAPLLAEKDGGGLEVHALDLHPEQIYRHAYNVFCAGAKELIFGIDRFTKPGQGTTHGNALVCVHLRDPMRLRPEMESAGEVRIGIIEYDVDPVRALPWNWENEWWQAAVTRELASLLGPNIFSQFQIKKG